MDLMFLLNALLKKKWVIIICTIAGVLAGLAFAFTKKKIYLSAAQYSTGFTMKQAISIKEDQGFNMTEIDQRFNNVIETFKSPKVIGMLSYGITLHDLEEKIPFRTLQDKDKESADYKAVNIETVKQILHKKLASLELLSTYQPEEEKTLKLLKLYGYDNISILKNLNIDRVQRTDFLNIFFSSENPELSAYIVNSIGKEFSRFYNSINTVRTGESAAKMDSLTQAKKKEVDSLTRKLQFFKAAQGTPDLAGKSNAASELVNTLSGNLVEAESKLNLTRSQLGSVNEQLNSLGSAPAPVNNNAEILTLQTQNRELIRQLSEKGGEDPILQQRISDNTKKITALSSQGGSGSSRADVVRKREDLLKRKFDLQADLDATTQTVNSLRSQVSRYSSIASSGGGLDVTANAIQSDLTIATKEYENLKSRLEIAQDVNVAPDINFKQTLTGQPAIKPESSNKLLILAIAGMSSLLLSMLSVIILDFLDTSLRAPSIFSRSTKLKLLTAINKIDLTKHNLSDYFTFKDGEVKKQEAQTFIENIRKLRFEIENSGKKIILVTSTKPQEGKSIIIESLANSFSLSKKKVLLIDTNFSNNTLTEKFDAKPVLEQFSVNGEKNILDKFWNITSMTKIPNTDIVGCKEGNYSPAEILPKNGLLDNLVTVAAQYDYVMLEGASLNIHADSKELTRYVDGIIAVFSATSVVKQPDKESIQFLKSTGNKFIGAVLNNIEMENIEL